MTDYRDTLDPYADSKGQQRQIHALTGMDVSVDTGTSYTYVLADANGYKRHNNATAITAVIPPNSSAAFSIGTRIWVEQAGVGQVTIMAGSGVTVNQPESLALSLSERWSIALLTKVGINSWVAVGGLEESGGGAPDNALTLGGDYLTLGDDFLVLGT